MVIVIVEPCSSRPSIAWQWAGLRDPVEQSLSRLSVDEVNGSGQTSIRRRKIAIEHLDPIPETSNLALERCGASSLRGQGALELGDTPRIARLRLNKAAVRMRQLLGVLRERADELVSSGRGDGVPK
jgi:hypothetical protein